MKTWSDVQTFIDAHSLPYKVIRWNMSLRGVLVDALTNDSVMHTVKDAATFIQGYWKQSRKG
jgi:hypothetical protein